MFYWEKVVAATQAPGQAIADSDEALYPCQILNTGTVNLQGEFGPVVPEKESHKSNYRLVASCTTSSTLLNSEK
jgi:hypothetical protein